MNRKEAKRIKVRKSTFVVAGINVFLRVCRECVVFYLLVCFVLFGGRGFLGLGVNLFFYTFSQLIYMYSTASFAFTSTFS